MNKINASYHGKCLNNFYSLVATHQKTHSFAAFTCWVFFTALQLVNKNCSCTHSLDKYLRTLTCTNLNWVTWKVRTERKRERKGTHYSLYSILISSHQWPRQNFSLQYQYNIKLINNENLKNQSGDYELIQNQILWTNIIRIVSQIVRWITI